MMYFFLNLYLIVFKIEVFMKKAFTLAEIMIVLTVIGVLTCILLPSAFHSMPDENIMKFKKANTTLYRVINELVSSDKYYLNGDLGVKPNGDLIDGTHTGDYTYFCETIADILSVKSVNCKSNATNENGYHSLGTGSLHHGKRYLDLSCKQVSVSNFESEISTIDNVSFYRTNPHVTFGINSKNAHMLACYNADGTQKSWAAGESHEWCNDIDFSGLPTTDRVFGGQYVDSNGFDYEYVIVCIDVDGIPSNGSENCDDVNDICPFGYGIRADGKILTGARADEWIKKSIQQNE